MGWVPNMLWVPGTLGVVDGPRVADGPKVDGPEVADGPEVVDTSGATDTLVSPNMLLVPNALGVGGSAGNPNTDLVPHTLLAFNGLVERPGPEQNDRCVAWQLPSRADNLPFWTHVRQSPFKVFYSFVAASCSACLKSMRKQSHALLPPNNILKSPGKFWYCCNLSRIDLMVDSRILPVMGHRPTRKSSWK